VNYFLCRRSEPSGIGVAVERFFLASTEAAVNLGAAISEINSPKLNQILVPLFVFFFVFLHRTENFPHSQSFEL
jgi:hypothetical protein